MHNAVIFLSFFLSFVVHYFNDVFNIKMQFCQQSKVISSFLFVHVFYYVLVTFKMSFYTVCYQLTLFLSLNLSVICRLIYYSHIYNVIMQLCILQSKIIPFQIFHLLSYFMFLMFCNVDMKFCPSKVECYFVVFSFCHLSC